MAITLEEVETIAELAKLTLTDDEKAMFQEQLSAILAAEHPDWRVYWVDPGDMRTQMHQEAFPGEDISDRPLPEVSLPGFSALIEGNYASGRYQAMKLQ